MEENGFYAFDDMLFPEVGTESAPVSADKAKAGTLVRPDLQPQVREEDQMRVDIHVVHGWTERIRRLDTRVTELLESNNRLVEERRAMAVERDAAQGKLATLHKYAKGFVEAMGDDPEGDEEEFLAISEGLRAALVDAEVLAASFERNTQAVERRNG